MTTNEPAPVEQLLKSCPFCGREAVWATKGDREFRGPWLAHCREQDCPGHQYEQDEQGGYTSARFSKAEAITAWNTRIASTPTAEPDEGLVEMISQLRQLARKQEGYGMAMRNDRHESSLNLFGDRAKSAIWLLQNAERIAERLAATPSIRAKALEDAWQPIGTAPKDGTYILIWSGWFGGSACIAWWSEDKHANKPMPRWETRDRSYGRRAFIEIPPTHWMPLSCPRSLAGEQSS